MRHGFLRWIQRRCERLVRLLTSQCLNEAGTKGHFMVDHSSATTRGAGLAATRRERGCNGSGPGQHQIQHAATSLRRPNGDIFSCSLMDTDGQAA